MPIDPPPTNTERIAMRVLLILAALAAVAISLMGGGCVDADARKLEPQFPTKLNYSL